MPAVSRKQQKMMGADLARAKVGKKTVTRMTREQLEDFAGTPRKNLPAKKSKGQKPGPVRYIAN